MYKPISIGRKLSVAKRLQQHTNDAAGTWRGAIDKPTRLAASEYDAKRDGVARTVNLLNIIHSLEEMKAGISKPALHELLNGAILACGFRDEAAALRALLRLAYPELLSEDIICLPSPHQPPGNRSEI